jgi:hypothetical protein
MMSLDVLNRDVLSAGKKYKDDRLNKDKVIGTQLKAR